MFITTNDATIYATAFGSPTAPALLAIGGWIGSWELWAEPLSILSQQWRAIAYDHRGAGVTVAPVASITFENMVDDVFAVLDAYGIEQCVLAAESAGAVTALGAALKHPQRITGLVIVDGMYFRPPQPDGDPFLLGLQKAYPMTLDRFVELCVPEPDCDHIKRWGRQIIDRAAHEAAIALYNLAGAVDLRAELSKITQPMLILHGEADALVPVQAAQGLAKTLPNAKLVLLPGAGHVPTMTRPVEIAQEIINFF
ncbi:MAG: alpha/beta hydrolase [Caldilineaceae bacterium]|nr:alpha/beta hydrolase [Caldilineaceae bacterium]